MAIVQKIDSNVTGLRIAEEASIGVLPMTPVWYAYEPNSYSDFGGEISTVARNPINAGRQRQKGVTVDLDASGGFNSDWTQTNFIRLLRGFFFAQARETYNSKSFNTPGAGVTNISVDGTDNGYESTAFGIGSGRRAVLANHLLYVTGYANGANNGLKVVASVTADTDIDVTDTGLVDETAVANAQLQIVGYQFASGTADIDASVSAYPRLIRASGSVDFTTLGLIPGEFVYIGGDQTAERFATAVNNGWARVRSVGATFIEFDKTSGTMVDEVGAALTVRIFFGHVLKNEIGSEIVRRTYQVERTLGAPDDANLSQIQSEYLIGAVPSELSINFATADKVTMDVSFVAIDNEQRTGATGVKAGIRPALSSEDAFNTSNDVSRVKMVVLSAIDSNPTALFAYLTDFSVTINNNLTANKAISRLGAFEVTAGQFTVEGSATAYFSSVEAVAAVRNNADVSFDFALAKDNHGIAVDVPLVALGDARLNVEQDAPITLPLSLPAGADRLFNHTLLMSFFPYLPNAAG